MSRILYLYSIPWQLAPKGIFLPRYNRVGAYCHYKLRHVWIPYGFCEYSQMGTRGGQYGRQFKFTFNIILHCKFLCHDPGLVLPTLSSSIHSQPSPYSEYWIWLFWCISIPPLLPYHQNIICTFKTHFPLTFPNFCCQQLQYEKLRPTFFKRIPNNTKDLPPLSWIKPDYHILTIKEQMFLLGGQN
jgi:hypothetical protein